MNIIDVKNLGVVFKGRKKDSQIIDDISFSVKKGECLCILGESGSGKSMTMKAVMGLLDSNFKITGEAHLQEKNLLTASKEELRQMRGKNMTMILQNPMVCFDSLYRIDYQINETLQEHTDWSKEEIHKKSIEILEKMQIRQPQEVLKKYPHQLSGGMLQRIMIGIAIALDPKILIADEPTTAIDSITQFEIMKEFERLKQQGVTMIFITHDLGVASMIADKIIVMNKGEIVDRGTFEEIKKNQKDEYTKHLVSQKMRVMEAYKKALGKDKNSEIAVTSTGDLEIGGVTVD